MDRELLTWSCILAAASGLLAAGVEEAVRLYDPGWIIFLTALATVTVGLYFWVAHGLFRRWIDFR